VNQLITEKKHAELKNHGSIILDELIAYVGDEGLSFWNSTSAFPSLAPFAQDLLAATASHAYVERVFSVCGHLTAGKRNRLCKKL